MTRIDQDLVTAFTSIAEPADRIACFRPIRDRFLSLLSEETRQLQDEDALCWRLLQLRKQKKLPALHREAN
jgi:hypothetical protein